MANSLEINIIKILDTIVTILFVVLFTCSPCYGSTLISDIICKLELKYRNKFSQWKFCHLSMYRLDSPYVVSYRILNRLFNPEGTCTLVPFWESSVAGDNILPPFKFSQYLPSYLAGLWEGDGHLTFKRDKDNTIVGATLAITFHMKDQPLCEHLQKLLGGNIRLKTAENACVLSFQNRDYLFKIVKLLSGCLRSPKLLAPTI